MRSKVVIPLLALGLAVTAACEADQEALEQGVDLDAPAEIENAPLVDTVGPEGLGDMNTGAPMTEVEPDPTAGFQTPADTVM